MVKAQPISKRRLSRLLFNPEHQQPRKSGAKRQSKRANPGELIAMGWLNPKEGQVKKKSKKKTPGAGKKRNPGSPAKFAHKKPKPPKRRNPNLRGGIRRVLSKPVEIVQLAVFAALGLLAARQLPQLILGQRNQGPIGYLGNLISAAVAAGLAGAAAGPAAGTAALTGGSLYLFNRLLGDYSQLGQHLTLSGVGDAAAAGKLGAIVPGYFAHPAVIDRATGRPVIPRAIVERVAEEVLARVPAALPGPSNASLTGCGRFQQRF